MTVFIKVYIILLLSTDCALSKKFPRTPNNEFSLVNYQLLTSHEELFNDANGGHNREDLFPNFVDQYYRTSLRKRRSQFGSVSCEEIVCQFGGACQEGKCKCLSHYTGKYCDQKIDYCQPNPCAFNVTCIPRLGGFTCNCPPGKTGKSCDITIAHRAINMKRPDFMHEPLQYAGVNYHYVFGAERLGDRPKVRVDFGDGTNAEQKDPITTFEYPFNELALHFKPTNATLSRLEAYKFEHTYWKPQVYNVSVRAWNKHYEVYGSNYQVRVIDVNPCILNVTLHNTAVDKEDALQFYRQNSLNIQSRTSSNCGHLKLEYRWKLYRVNSFDDVLGVENLYRNKMEERGATLNVPAYSLDYGKYVAEFKVEMIRPKCGLSERARTWFEIRRRRVVAHIEGGHRVWMCTKSTFYLNAGSSYDPNYSKTKQPRLTFTWTCRPSKGGSCKGMRPSRETGSVLVIPANTLSEGKYVFQVWINGRSNESARDYVGTALQEVRATNDRIPLYSIVCLRNCIAGRADPTGVIALRGTDASNSGDELVVSWVAFPNPDRNENKGMVLNNTDYANDSRSIILYPGQLKAGQRFKLVFSGYNAKWATVLKGHRATSAEIYLDTYEEPTSGHCLVYPTVGYTVFTAFSVACYDFSSGTKGSRDEPEMISYEVVQFNDVGGILVGYDVTNSVHNMTLGPGYEKDDYVTTLQITAVDTQGSLASVHCNVTVFPLLRLLREPEEVARKFAAHVASGLDSPLNVLLSRGNYLGVVQQIVSVAFAMEEFRGSQNSASADEIDVGIEKLPHILIDYLHRVPVLDLKSVRHVGAALNHLLRLLIWEPRVQRVSGIGLGINILGKLIDELEEIRNVHEEVVFRRDMDDIGTSFVGIASSLTKILSSNVRSFKCDGRWKRSLDDIVTVLHRFAQLYLQDKVPNERTTLITGPTLMFMMKKGSPEYLDEKSFAITGRASSKLLFDGARFNKSAIYNLEIIITDYNLKPYDCGDPEEDCPFPFVAIKLTNDLGTSRVEAGVEISLKPIFCIEKELTHVSLPVRLFWQLKEEHIRVYRVAVPKGGKLLVKFRAIEDKHRIRVVIKRNARPRLLDFRSDSIDVPQEVPELAEDRGLSVLVNDEAGETWSHFYMGVLLHTESLRRLMRDVEESILPRSLLHAEEEAFNKLSPETFGPNSSYEDRRFPVSFAAYSVRCVLWSDSRRGWTQKCNVTQRTTASRVTCTCSGHAGVTASFQRVPVHHERHSILRYRVAYQDNPLVLFLVAFSSVLFVGLFKWAAQEDHRDRYRRTVYFLIDNYPQHEYCYLVIVQTGRMVRAGTTANVSITLEGTHATSLPHILNDSEWEVLSRGSQNWFVVKTARPLGEIYCVHLWTDYSGSNPSWFCNKITVHDIQEQELWFFVVDKWFNPLQGSGSMSYTVYQATDDVIFSPIYHLQDCIVQEFDSGMHGWLSIFHKYPYNSYTRRQRVAVAYLHAILLMLVLILLRDIPVLDSPYHQIHEQGYFRWDTRDLLYGLSAPIVAFPVHVFFVTLFRCVRPPPQWTESGDNRALGRFNMQDEETTDVVWINPETVDARDKVKLQKLEKGMRKQVSFYSDFFEPEGDRTLRSKYSLSRLEQDAGKSNVVALRTPSSTPETDLLEEPAAATTSSVSQLELNAPIYGEEIVTQMYCLPPIFVYLGWVLLFVAAVPSVYVTILYAVSYGWIMGLHYLVSLLFAVFFSSFLVEPLKLLLWSVCVYSNKKYKFSVEDRSDLVEILNPECKVPSDLAAPITEKINKLREDDMYLPIKAERVHKQIKNNLEGLIWRIITADCTLMALLMLLFVLMIGNTVSSVSYFNYKSVRELVLTSKRARQALVHIQTDIPAYLRGTVIPNLHRYHNGEGETELKPVIDEVNYLIGVVRLRQVRKSPDACRPQATKWAARCVKLYDKMNYSQGWSFDYGEAITWPESWVYNDWKRPYILGLLQNQNETAYPPGHYRVHFGRNKEESLAKLDYLERNNWFDYLSAVIYVDFILYNPHSDHLSLGTLMAERTEQGVYYLHDRVEMIRVPIEDNFEELWVLAVLSVLFIFLMMHVRKSASKHSLVTPRKMFATKWQTMKRILLLLGTITLTIYIKKNVGFGYYIGKIAQAAKPSYIDFGTVDFWDRFLTVLIALMIFLVLVEMCHIVTAFYHIKIAWTVLCNGALTIFYFFLLYMLAMITFTLTAYVLFGATNYHFYTLLGGFNMLVEFSQQNAKVRHGGSVPLLTTLYYLNFIAALLILLRYLIATVMCHTYSAVKRNAQSDIHKTILSKYTKKYFDSVDAAPNRKPLKRNLYLKRSAPAVHGVAYLFIDLWYDVHAGQRKFEKSVLRQKAMDYIVFGLFRNKCALEILTTYSAKEKYQRKEQAKALTRTIMITTVLRKKLEYLNAKMDILIREERYKTILGRK